MERECPYKSLSEYKPLSTWSSGVRPKGTLNYAQLTCSSYGGWLCDKCKEDRADKRFNRLIDAVRRVNA